MKPSLNTLYASASAILCIISAAQAQVQSTTPTSQTTAATTPASSPPAAPTPVLLPPGWVAVTSRPCAVDNEARIYVSHEMRYFPDNTPAVCAAYCDSLGFRFAGVEYGRECHCGSGYVGGQLPPAADPIQCSSPCPGNWSQTCGGGWRIQLYEKPGPGSPEVLPAGWSKTIDCAVDDEARVITNPEVRVFEGRNTPLACANQCNASGYAYAGVEYGQECICGNGLRAGIQQVPASECNMACTGNSAWTCGAGWRIQIYKKDPVIPAGWSEHIPCAVDDESRIFTGAIAITNLWNNRPDSCIDLCNAGGYNYAGVEYGGECICGNGIRAGVESRDAGECNMPCAGDSTLTCGAGWRIEVFKRN